MLMLVFGIFKYYGLNDNILKKYSLLNECYIKLKNMQMLETHFYDFLFKCEP